MIQPRFGLTTGCPAERAANFLRSPLLRSWAARRSHLRYDLRCSSNFLRGALASLGADEASAPTRTSSSAVLGALFKLLD
jgi:hypothetical protein